MRLSDYKGEEALDLLAEIMEPAAEIFADPVIAEMARDDTPQIKMITTAIKTHKAAVLQIMAALDGVSISDKKAYREYVDGFRVLTLPAKVLELVNDPDLQSLFHSQGQMTDGGSSGSAMENIEDGGK